MLALDVRMFRSPGEMQTVAGHEPDEYGVLLEHDSIDLADDRTCELVWTALLNLEGYPHLIRPQEIRARLGSDDLDALMRRLPPRPGVMPRVIDLAPPPDARCEEPF